MTVADVATWRPFTQTSAEPTTPLTISVAAWPGCRFGGEVGAPPPGHAELLHRVRADMLMYPKHSCMLFEKKTLFGPLVSG